MIPLRLALATATLPWWRSGPIDLIQSGFFCPTGYTQCRMNDQNVAIINRRHYGY